MNRDIRPLVAVVSARYRTLLQYRAAAFAGFATQLFWGAIRLMILAAFFAAATEPQPMDLPQIVAYVWLGQALLGMLPWNVDADFRAQVRDGTVGYDLLRPLDLYAYWFGRTLAFRIAAPTLRGIPMVLFAMVLLPLAGLGDWALTPPASTVAFAGFVVSLVLAAMLATAVTLLAHISLLWTISGVGMDRVLTVLVTVFSGLIVPLPLFPDWLQPLLNWQPFRGLADVPYRIYSGNIPPADIAGELLFVLVWTIALVWLGRLILFRGVRRMVVQGG